MGRFSFSRGRVRDDVIARLLRNVSYLLSANLLVALLGLASMALVARALGPDAFGILILAESYVRLMDVLVRPEPWHAVIRFGTGKLEAGDGQSFKQLVKFATAIDVVGALCSAAAAGMLASLAGHYFGWEDRTKLIATIFSFALLAHLAATPVGILRLFDRFNFLAASSVVSAGIRLALIAAAFAAGGGIWIFLIIFMISHVLEGLVPFTLAWRELHRRGFGDALRAPLREVLAANPGIWGFIWSSNLSMTFRATTQHLDTLLVGGVLDPSAAAFYHVAKRIGMAVLKLGEPIQQAIFPDLAKLWVRREILRLKRTIFQVNAFIGLIGALALLAMLYRGELLVRLALGAEYAQANMLIVLQMVAATLSLFGLSLRPALLSMGMHRQILAISVLSTATFYVIIITALPIAGAVGATMAHVAFNAVTLVSSLFLFANAIGKASTAETAAPQLPASQGP
jgi:O-antigen/teichoic acid export membrane protein